ncbi:MAG: hypothetical protein Q9198_009949, partial [Flavoplaca austrocitrina]
VWCRKTGTVITMFEDDTDTVCSLGELVQQAFLKEWQSACSIRLSTLENDDGTPIFVIRGIEPIAQFEGAA